MHGHHKVVTPSLVSVSLSLSSVLVIHPSFKGGDGVGKDWGGVGKSGKRWERSGERVGKSSGGTWESVEKEWGRSGKDGEEW